MFQPSLPVLSELTSLNLLHLLSAWLTISDFPFPVPLYIWASTLETTYDWPQAEKCLSIGRISIQFGTDVNSQEFLWFPYFPCGDSPMRLAFVFFSEYPLQPVDVMWTVVYTLIFPLRSNCDNIGI